MAGPAKAAGALRTIGELSAETGLPQHILRYWETRFPELRPLQRAGNRRYYRPEDVALVKRIDQLLNHDGYTVRGVQALLKQGAPAPSGAPPAPVPTAPAPVAAVPAAPARPVDLDRLADIRNFLVRALASDR